MGFEFRQTIGFKHCDPAGIVFYPRYFEMFNDCVEAFLTVGWDGISRPCTRNLQSQRRKLPRNFNALCGWVRFWSCG